MNSTGEDAISGIPRLEVAHELPDRQGRGLRIREVEDVVGAGEQDESRAGMLLARNWASLTSLT